MLKLDTSWGWVVNDRSRRLYPWGGVGTPCAGSGVGSTAGLNSCGQEKITCHTGNRRENLQLVVSRYTYYVIPAPDERYTSSYWCYSLVPAFAATKTRVLYLLTRTVLQGEGFSLTPNHRLVDKASVVYRKQGSLGCPRILGVHFGRLFRHACATLRLYLIPRAIYIVHKVSDWKYRRNLRDGDINNAMKW